MTPLNLKPHEWMRYQQHLLLPEIGASGQQALKNASVLIVGVGALGNASASLLAAAGVGRLGLMDDDRVELSNLPRQTLFGLDDLGDLKTQAAMRRLKGQNDQIQYSLHQARLESNHAASIIQDYDLVVDGTDCVATRYLMDETCLALGKPWVMGAVMGYQGQVSFFASRGGATYHQLYPHRPAETPETCQTLGVLGAVPSIIGAIQSAQVIAYLTGQTPSLQDALLHLDIQTMQINRFPIGRHANASHEPSLASQPAPSPKPETLLSPVPWRADVLYVDCRPKPQEAPKALLTPSHWIAFSDLLSQPDGNEIQGLSSMIFVCDHLSRSRKMRQAFGPLNCQKLPCQIGRLNESGMLEVEDNHF